MDLLVLESRDDDPVVRAALGGRAAQLQVVLHLTTARPLSIA